MSSSRVIYRQLRARLRALEGERRDVAASDRSPALKALIDRNLASDMAVLRARAAAQMEAAETTR